MFQQHQSRSTLGLMFSMAEVTFHATVRKVRKAHGNAVLSIILSIVQSILFIAFFYLMFAFTGMQGAAIRGNFMLYLMTGIFLYLTHIQTLRAVMTSDGPTSQMMQHAPMNTYVSIISAALSVLYTQTIAVMCILLLIHTVIEPISIHYWPGALKMYLLVWLLGLALGIIFMALKPWSPEAVNLISMIYMRANMIFSGKMFVANMLPSVMLPIFTWNPLFHIIDQIRGDVFVNYFPHVTNEVFPISMTLILLLIGLMLEFYTRKHASASWDARR
ncbi:ABC transporter permease [Gymnodinialimonas sp. 2305UL16-5]|uniref:ABC transporter permease n=1 Tax=Gymnodinialimonas mytili TaxID=3126503 RepID=UPI0030B3346E